MSDNFRGKYRIDTARKPGWDYSSPGDYFVTVCTHRQQHFFGECKNGEIKLNAAGAIAQGFWYEIPVHYTHIELSKFKVMPNHIHGILPIGLKDGTPPAIITEIDRTLEGDLRRQPDFYKKIRAKPGSISMAISGYKYICKKTICEVMPDLGFAWHPRFHDRIIRDEREFKTVSIYIVDNAKTWDNDKLRDPW